MGARLHDRHRVVAIGSDIDQAHLIGYAQRFNMADISLIVQIGTGCHVWPRTACPQRAHQLLHATLPVDANRRGQTCYES